MDMFDEEDEQPVQKRRNTCPSQFAVLTNQKEGETEEECFSRSCRNAWGNESYASIINSAINSAPSKKLKLKGIYDYFVDKFDYFQKNKDSKGWKNSVRHNLSLSKQFKRKPSSDPKEKGYYWCMEDPSQTATASSSAPVPRANSISTVKRKLSHGVKDTLTTSDAGPVRSKSVNALAQMNVSLPNRAEVKLESKNMPGLLPFEPLENFQSSNFAPQESVNDLKMPRSAFENPQLRSRAFTNEGLTSTTWNNCQTNQVQFDCYNQGTPLYTDSNQPLYADSNQPLYTDSNQNVSTFCQKSFIPLSQPAQFTRADLLHPQTVNEQQQPIRGEHGMFYQQPDQSDLDNLSISHLNPSINEIIFDPMQLAQQMTLTNEIPFCDQISNMSLQEQQDLAHSRTNHSPEYWASYHQPLSCLSNNTSTSVFTSSDSCQPQNQNFLSLANESLLNYY